MRRARAAKNGINRARVSQLWVTRKPLITKKQPTPNKPKLSSDASRHSGSSVKWPLSAYE
jgi:hypothetical protein